MLYENNHRGTEKKDEGGRMMDEKEETSITVSFFILSKFSPCLCASVVFYILLC